VCSTIFVMSSLVRHADTRRLSFTYDLSKSNDELSNLVQCNTICLNRNFFFPLIFYYTIQSCKKQRRHRIILLLLLRTIIYIMHGRSGIDSKCISIVRITNTFVVIEYIIMIIILKTAYFSTPFVT